VHDECEHQGADEDEAQKNDACARGPGEPVTLECIADRPSATAPRTRARITGMTIVEV
jgi:hypothetical protein